MRTVTVGYDGSPESRAAAGWAAVEALRRGLPLRVVHVWNWQAYDEAMAHDGERTRDGQEPREVAAELEVRYPGLEITAERIPGRPAEILMAVAKKSALLVLGSRPLGFLGGFLVGSVAHETVAQVAVPVALVRAPEPDLQPAEDDVQGRDVVVGVDLVHHHDDVLDFAFAAAFRWDTPLRVVHTWRTPPVYGPFPSMTDPGERAALRRQETEQLNDVLRPWQEAYPEVEVSEHVVAAHAAQHLVHCSANAGLLVVGRRIRHTPVGPRIGPVTHAVMHHAAAPVAVIPYT